MYAKKTPMRMCIGCGEMKPKKELIRVVKSKEGDISLDKTGKMPGRGAYVCHNGECLGKAKKTKKLNRTFACNVADEIYDKLSEELNNFEQ